MITVIKGEKRYIGMQVIRRRSSQPFTIEQASYNVADIQQGVCEIHQNDKEVFFLLDTTVEDFEKGLKYLSDFTVIIEGMDKILKGKVLINVV